MSWTRRRSPFDVKFCPFFKCLLDFRAHALQLELNKVVYTNFVKFRLQSMSFKIERAFEKRTKNVVILPIPTLKFPGGMFNFSKILYGLPSTLCLTGELWPLRFNWHHDMRVTNCQSSAMTFVFMQYSFCYSFWHGLISSKMNEHFWFSNGSVFLGNLCLYLYFFQK